MKIMKSLTATAFVLLFSLSAFAQYGQRRQAIEQNIEAQHVAFITQKLELTPDESARFWPIFNEFRSKEKALRKGNRPDGTLRNISEVEAEQLIEQHLDTEQKVLNLKREYYGKLKSAIPASKIARLRPAEEAFKLEILQRLRERRMENRMNK